MGNILMRDRVFIDVIVYLAHVIEQMEAQHREYAAERRSERAAADAGRDSQADAAKYASYISEGIGNLDFGFSYLAQSSRTKITKSTKRVWHC